MSGHDIRTVPITRIDITTIESLAETAIRSGEVQIALEGWALALRLRAETGLHPKRRKDDPQP